MKAGLSRNPKVDLFKGDEPSKLSLFYPANREQVLDKSVNCVKRRISTPNLPSRELASPVNTNELCESFFFPT